MNLFTITATSQEDFIVNADNTLTLRGSATSYKYYVLGKTTLPIGKYNFSGGLSDNIYLTANAKSKPTLAFSTGNVATFELEEETEVEVRLFVNGVREGTIAPTIEDATPMVNKVVYGDEVLLDITDSTVTEDTLMEGETAYSASGRKITGRATGGTGDYEKLTNLPIINEVELKGRLTLTELGISWVGTHAQFEVDNPNIPDNTLLYFTDDEQEEYLTSDFWEDKAKPIAKGDYCIDNNALWKSLTTNSNRPSEADTSNWRKCKVMDEISALNSNLTNKFVRSTNTSTADEKVVLKDIFQNHVAGNFEIMVTVYGKTLYGVAAKYNNSIFSATLTNIETGESSSYATSDGGINWKVADLNTTKQLTITESSGGAIYSYTAKKCGNVVSLKFTIALTAGSDFDVYFNENIGGSDEIVVTYYNGFTPSAQIQNKANVNGNHLKVYGNSEYAYCMIDSTLIV